MEHIDSICFKKGETLRFCVHYRKLNAVTKRDFYPISLMDKCIDSLCKATVFSTLDANSAYWYIEIDDAEKKKTAITSNHGLFRFVRIPFKLQNAPETFQRTMDMISSCVKRQIVLVYPDDIVVLSKTPHQHIDHVRKVLSLWHSAGTTFKFKKYKFINNTIDYLGHVIYSRHLGLAANRTHTIFRLHSPTNFMSLRSFLALWNIFRRFVFSFVQVVAPLDKSPKKDQPAWITLNNSNQLYVIETLKNALIFPSILALLYFGGHMMLDKDACNIQIGCVLLQKQPVIEPNQSGIEPVLSLTLKSDTS